MIGYLKRKLVPEARQWWRLWSVRLLGLALVFDMSAVLTLVELTPPPLRNLIPVAVFEAIRILLYVGALIARFVPQPKMENDNVETGSQDEA